MRRLGGQQRPLHPAGQLEVALHRPLGDDLFVHLGVVDRNRRLAGDAGEHFQIGIGEAAPLVERIDLDHADRLAVAAHHRGAHHRANGKIGDALGHAEPLVAGGVGREDRFARLHRFFDNRAADPHPFFVAGAAGFYGDRHERPVGLGPHDDEAAIGLRENLEQAVEDFRQDVFDGERLSQVVRDLDQRGQLYFGLGRETPTYGAAADVERGHDAGAGRVLGVVDQLGDARLFEVAHRIEDAGPEAGVEAELLIANDELIAFVERRAIGEALVVEERAVAALQVFDEVAAALAENRGMAAADGGHVERHLAIGAAADDRPIAIELEARARSRTFDKLQKCHAALTARSKGERGCRVARKLRRRQAAVVPQRFDRIRAERRGNSEPLF